MKRLFLLVLLLAVAGVLGAATEIPSVAQKEEPFFDALGFCLKGEAYVAVELHITKVVQVNLKDQNAAKPLLKAVFLFGATPYPVKIIKPDLDGFEGDIIELGEGDGKKLVTPIGHISFKLEKPDKIHTVADGEVTISLEDEEKSGRYRLLMNELPSPKGGGPAGGGADAAPTPGGK